MTIANGVKYKRVLLKLSGEALSGHSSMGIDKEVLDFISKEISSILKLGVQVAIVIGGGNLFRGEELFRAGLGRITGDHMGMLATLMNALAMRDVFERDNLPSRIMSAIPMSGIVDHYDRRKAMHHLEVGRVVICAAGTGTPLVTTDSAASLRGIEVGADIVLKATNVDGIYAEDPEINPLAERYEHLTYKQALSGEFGVMDLAAFCQCRDHGMPLRVFRLKPGVLVSIVNGENEGTLVDGEIK